MGYDFTPNNPEAGDFHLGAFSWPVLLHKSGAGNILEYTEGIDGAASYVTYTRPNKEGQRSSAGTNDGFPVTDEEAKIVAKLFRAFARMEDLRREYFEKLAPEEQQRRTNESSPWRPHYVPMRADFVQKARDFADWAEKSGGFVIW